LTRILLYLLHKKLTIFSDVNYGFNVSLVIKCFAELRIEHIAWIVRGFILQELLGEVSPPVLVCFSLEIPAESVQQKQLTDFVQVYTISLLKFLFQGFICKGLENNIVIPL
jgi:hypothetical protein